MSLEDVKFASPCNILWDDMDVTEDDRVRFCGKCDRNVYNLSKMNREEALAFLQNNEGNECVQIWKREDGTVVTADCPPDKPRPPKPPIKLGGAPLPTPKIV